MKYLPLFLILLLFSFYSCSENESISDPVNPGDQEENNEEVTAQKKGVCLTTNNFVWSLNVSKLKPYWHYSWGTDLKEEEPDSIDYVPMFWGSQITEEKIALLKQLKAEGKIQYILGFNEPDNKEQSNMTVDEAIALWPKLEEIGLPLGSPATVGGTNEWMQEFMSKATASGLRIDFIAMHKYSGTNPVNFINTVKEVHDLYNLPIWITEFAVADWNASSVETNQYTENEALTFMKEVLPQLDTLDYVERYSWFSGSPDNSALAPSALFDADNNLTALGQYYADYTPNPQTGSGKEPSIYSNIEGNLISNGNFGDYHVYGEEDDNVAESIGWFGYQITAEPSDAIENYSGKLQNGWSGDAALNNTFDVEAGKTYTISYYVKWLGTNGSIKMVLKDDSAILAWENAGKPSDSKPAILAGAPKVTADVNGNNSWTQVNFEYTVPEGINSLRLTLWKGNGTSMCLIDEVVAKEKSSTN